MNSWCCKRLRIQAKSEPPNTPTRETSSASFSLKRKTDYCTHLCIRNTWEAQTLNRAVGASVTAVKLPWTTTVPLHVAPLRGWKLGACHAAGHMLYSLSSALLRQAKHSIILIASGIPRLCCKGVSTINLPSLER